MGLTGDVMAFASRGVSFGPDLPYDAMVAAMPYLGLPIVWQSGLPTMLVNFLFSKSNESQEIMNHLSVNDNEVTGDSAYGVPYDFNEYDFKIAVGSFPKERDAKLYKANPNAQPINKLQRFERLVAIHNTSAGGVFLPFPTKQYEMDLVGQTKLHSGKPLETGYRNWFLQNLTSFEGSISDASLWYVTIEIPEIISGAIKSGSLRWLEPDGDEYIFSKFKDLTNDKFMGKSMFKTHGCFFCSAVISPGDGLEIEKTKQLAGMKHLAPIILSNGRNFDNLTNLSVRFMETNVSFTDSVIRPWLILLSHLGTRARKEDVNVKCNITMYQLGKSRANKNSIIKKKIVFHDAFPINIAQGEFTRQASNTLREIQTTWAYSHHTIENYHKSFSLLDSMGITL